MKFKCGKSKEEKEQAQLSEAVRLVNWHKVFAWKPKHFPSGYCVWLGYYKRRIAPIWTVTTRLDEKLSEEDRIYQNTLRRVKHQLAYLWCEEGVEMPLMAMRQAKMWFADPKRWETKE